MVKKTSKKGNRKPSIRQEKLVEGVLQGKSKRRAALDAGYAESTASVDVYKILEKPSIQARIQARIRESQIDTNEVIGTLVSHMRGNLADILPNDELLKDAEERGVAHLIKEIETTTRTIYGQEGESAVLETKRKVKIHDSQAAAKTLTGVFGLNKADETHPNDVERQNEREIVREWLKEQGILQSDTVQ